MKLRILCSISRSINSYGCYCTKNQVCSVPMCALDRMDLLNINSFKPCLLIESDTLHISLFRVSSYCSLFSVFVGVNFEIPGQARQSSSCRSCYSRARSIQESIRYLSYARGQIFKGAVTSKFRSSDFKAQLPRNISSKNIQGVSLPKIVLMGGSLHCG